MCKLFNEPITVAHKITLLVQAKIQHLNFIKILLWHANQIYSCKRNLKTQRKLLHSKVCKRLVNCKREQIHRSYNQNKSFRIVCHRNTLYGQSLAVKLQRFVVVNKRWMMADILAEEEEDTNRRTEMGKVTFVITSYVADYTEKNYYNPNNYNHGS